VLQTNEILTATIQYYEGVVKGSVPRNRPPAALVQQAAPAPAKTAPTATEEQKTRAKVAPIAPIPSSNVSTPQRVPTLLAPPSASSPPPATTATTSEYRINLLCFAIQICLLCAIINQSVNLPMTRVHP
jgi:hypothetical protein